MSTLSRLLATPAASTVLALLFLVFLTLIVAGQARAEPIWGQRIRVIDGDTIKVDSQKPVRLVGFNAPETRRAQCDAEREAGGKATRRVRELVRADSLDLSYVACNCPPGTQGTQACNYGRSCATLTAGG